MRARIIFQGLTLFKFAKPTQNAKAGDNLGTLEAWLVSDPDHAPMPLHRHTPMLGFIGRDRDQPAGSGRVEPRRPIPVGGDVPKNVEIDLQGHKLDSGVYVDGSFVDYVPRLEALYGQEPQGKTIDKLITKKIIIRSGRIRTREFVCWDWHGYTPAKLGYMDSKFQGFGANEVVVDIGDDSDFEQDDHGKYLAISGKGVDHQLWAYTKGGNYADDIEPNTVDVVIDNSPARRRRPVFWGLHFQLLFDAAGFSRRVRYNDIDQYNSFVKAAEDYDDYEWNNDLGAMGVGHPFPYLINPRVDQLEGLEDAAHRDEIVSPPPLLSWRQKGEAIPKSGHDMHHGTGGSAGGGASSSGSGGMTAGGSTMPGMGGMRAAPPGTPGCDPVNSNICLPAFH